MTFLATIFLGAEYKKLLIKVPLGLSGVIFFCAFSAPKMSASNSNTCTIIDTKIAV
jgi:hypothetical protein